MSDTDDVLADLAPSSPLMIPAWLGSLHYCIGNPEIVAAFREATGNRWEPASSAIEQLVDDATGAGRDFIRAFAKWHNERIWGEQDGKPFDLE